MITLDNLESTRVGSDGKKYVKCSLFADTKSEVTDNITGADVDRLEDNCDLDTGTFVMTAGFDVANLNSQHKWVWG